ncbi:MAG: chromate transporter [Firmicutes bacterium]|nr:chromate transporter [Bacillota bacterium]
MIYLQLFFVFARIGLFGFGGGMAMLPMIYQGAKTFDLMSAAEFSNLVAISQVTPGPIAVNAATYVGYHCAGTAGAVAATLGVAFPSFVLVMLVCYFISRFRESRLVGAAFAGIRPVTVGLIGTAVVFMAQSLDSAFDVVSAAIIVGTVILVGKFRISPIPIVIGAGLIGAFLCG